MKIEVADFRSDTVTRPTPEMLQCMLQAKVGDDGFDDDLTTHELQDYIANLFGMEAALFCPSGIMTNQIAVKVHTQPGDEVVAEEYAHTYYHESGGIAFNSGCQVRPIKGKYGIIEAKDILPKINPRGGISSGPTTLVTLENTTNFGGGHCYPIHTINEIKALCVEHEIKLHLDGARLFNALVATGQTPEYFGKVFDSISICLSKSLGAPIGSLLLGNKEFIQKARRYRKVFGGEMRQTGYLSAAGLFALRNNVERLKEDHRLAKQIEASLKDLPFIGEIIPVDTNIIIFEVRGKYTAEQLAYSLEKENIRTIAFNDHQIRIVTHMGITGNMVDHTISVLNRL